MSKKFRFLMVLVLVTGLLGGLLSGSIVSADPQPGARVQIPRIDLGDVFGTGGDWDTKIQIQNTTTTPTTVTVDFYAGYSAKCPDDGGGDILDTRTWSLPAKGVWTLHSTIPAGAEAAIVTCDPSVPLAVTVDRWGPDPNGNGLVLSSSYVGISEEMEGEYWKYYAPYVMYDYHDLSTVITIQNSGEDCTSVWIWYKEQDNCEYQVTQHIEALAPGESIRVGGGVTTPGAFPGADVPYPAAFTSAAPADWLGSAYISANVPLGIIVDQLTYIPPSVNERATLHTYRGLPYKPMGYVPGEPPTGEWDTMWYADLLYREWSGWTSAIQVQNLTQRSIPTFVTVDFMDQSGDEILFLGDWICRNGAQTFYLPAITDLGVLHPFGYVGAAEIASVQQVDYPGNLHDAGEPIFVVVDLNKNYTADPSTQEVRPTVPGETQGGAYNAHPLQEKEWAWEWFMPDIAMQGGGVTSRIALRNNANCNKFYGKIWIMDETGTEVGVIHTPWLHPKHLKVFDLEYQGFLYPGFVGAARFEVLGVEQLCDANNDGHVDNKPIMPSVVVVNYGWQDELGILPPATDLGDLTRIYEGIPVQGGEKYCAGSLYGEVSVRQENHGFDRAEINGAEVVAMTDEADLTAFTDSTGGYQIMGVRVPGDSAEVPMAVFKEGFFDGPQDFDEAPPTVYCGHETLQDFELICKNDLFVTVEDTGANAIPGATVSVDATYQFTFDQNETKTDEGTTDNAGKVTIEVAGATSTTVTCPGCGLVGTASAPGHDTRTGVPILQLSPDPWEWPGKEGENCYSTAYMNFTDGNGLCKWNTIVGTVEIGGQQAEGYTLKAIQMSNPDLPIVDEDVTTAAGVFSLENLSLASDGPDYRVQLWSPSDTYIDFLDFTVTTCGSTGVLSYTNGTWDGPENWVGP